MKAILLVDDDAVVRELYRQELVKEGFRVEVAADGLMAASALSWEQPDLVVLDLMMPRFSGVEVLEFMRSDPALQETPVVVVTNVFVGEMIEAARRMGIQEALNKAECTPAKLAGIVRKLLTAPASATAAEPVVTAPPPAPPTPAPARTEEPWLAQLNAKARSDFLNAAPATLGALREAFDGFKKSTVLEDRGTRLDEFCRELHSIAATAGLVDCPEIGLLSEALEGLASELTRAPESASASVFRTVAVTLDFLGVLFTRALAGPSPHSAPAQVLVVDDDAVSGLASVQALNRVRLEGRAIQDPVEGLRLLKQQRYDLILLDIEMPQMNGFDFCTKLRDLPGYAATPVMFVTLHGDFKNRAQSVLCGGSDLISKPFFPSELALKVVTHLIQGRQPPAMAEERRPPESEPLSTRPAAETETAATR